MYQSLFLKYRSSRPEVFCKKGVLKNFIKFTGKHLAQVFSCEFCEIFKSTYYYRTPLVAASENKVANLRPAPLLKKRL